MVPANERSTAIVCIGVASTYMSNGSDTDRQIHAVGG
jgi:hypothetical protein